ncbi:uncharacterized protein LOC131618060 [Vicia villosa]|uniref:uncharacterized protein LOC131618060 n=1 Tax=Vicia villosa TaxID=3911 RepID=UPI00273A7CD2|nr:uncharacterized protein LOC131618060 [Vicia villosa]
MVSVRENGNNIFPEHASNEGQVVSPRIGHEYQAEIPSVLKKSEQLSFQMNPADSEAVRDKSLSFAIGLEDSEPEELGYHEDSDSGQLGKSENHKLALALGRSSSTWSDADTKSFILGLFIFGKNFIQIKRFLENKGMGEILSFYYGMFYKTDGYRRWSECRKLKGRKCMIGEKLFTGLRQHELLSRLNPHVFEESQDTMLQVSKSYAEGRTSLEEYISSLKSAVGLHVLVEAVGIGKEKGDLTRFGMEPKKKNPALPAQTCKDLSSLGPSDIVQSLTGGFRLSKTKSNDLFWEAVWPRLLARGWHSEQPKNRGYLTSKDYLVFLIPGVDKFSRRKLVKGDHYFDSVRDVLSKVVAEPNILVLKEEEEEEEQARVGSCNEDKPVKGSNEDDLSDDHRQCYLKPGCSTYNKDHTKFMVVDTSMVHRGNPSDLRELKSVPVNSAPKVEVDVASKKYKGHKYMRKVKHNKEMSESIEQNLTKLTAIDTNRLSDGKLLKLKVKLKYPSVELEDASTVTNGLLRERNHGSSTDYLLRMAEAKMLICDKRKISKINSGATSKKDACDNLVNDANKMLQSQKNQQTCVFDDNPLNKIIKHQFNRKVRSGDSNHAAVPIKRRRLTACVNAEKSRIIGNSSGGLGSEKTGLPRSSSFPDANKNVWEPVGLQENGSSTAASADQSVEENTEKCESFTFNIPQVPSNSENNKSEQGLTFSTHKVVEKPLRTPCHVDSLEQHPDIKPRRQSTRTRPLTVRALECIANEFLHVQKRQKKKNSQIHQEPFNPCRKAHTRGKTMLLDNENAVLVQEVKHLNGDSSVS